MKSILSSGVTGILVSHSIGQIRDMCNKVLWLDHGKQICFTDKTQEICDAYEEYLITKKTPKDEKDIAFDSVNITADGLNEIKKKAFPVIDDEAGKRMVDAILSAKENGDSVGGVIECAAVGLPVGLGGPMFDAVGVKPTMLTAAAIALAGVLVTLAGTRRGKTGKAT